MLFFYVIYVIYVLFLVRFALYSLAAILAHKKIVADFCDCGGLAIILQQPTAPRILAATMRYSMLTTFKIFLAHLIQGIPYFSHF